MRAPQFSYTVYSDVMELKKQNGAAD